ncbi:MAG TPA: glycoside hydrolase family 43 protein, partial [Polyangiaceae bacterium]|nr:glycoside hydrolase family 43 protein [Polyangiaceae bacterium]
MLPPNEFRAREERQFSKMDAGLHGKIYTIGMRVNRGRWHGGLALVALAVAACGDDGSSVDSAVQGEGGQDQFTEAGSGGGAGSGEWAGEGGSGAGASGSNAGQGGVGGGQGGQSGTAGDGGNAQGSCTTRITYGSFWIHDENHPEDFDVTSGIVTWDGACVSDGANSYATLSNGWKARFQGKGTCVIALDYSECEGVATTCQTRVTYGPAWKSDPNHPASYDDVKGTLAWNGVCHVEGSSSYARLSNGWTPYFKGKNTCDLAFRYTQCGGLYTNPVLDVSCPDPGVVFDGTQYVMACTGGSKNAFPLRSSPDLVHWKSKGHIFPAASKPKWAVTNFWAPEIHPVANGYVAYFTAQHTNGARSIGAATAPSALGPFEDIGKPLLNHASKIIIDANQYQDPNGKLYLVWKEVVGNGTPQRRVTIYGRELKANGVEFVGTRKELITMDKDWEKPHVEGPWLIDHGNWYYLFYSANEFSTKNYCVGVARAKSPLGPYKKADQPILR